MPFIILFVVASSMHIAEISTKKGSKSLDKGEDPDFYSMYPSEFSETAPTPPQPTLTFHKSFGVILEDLLPKKTQNVMWQDRHFTLTHTRLLYYSSESKQQLKGCFNFVSLLKYSPQLKEEEGVLTLIANVPDRENGSKCEIKELLKLNFNQNHQKLLIWKNTIHKALNYCYTLQPKSFPMISWLQMCASETRAHYWNKINISVQEFHAYAHHLDIIFFRSKRSVACLHRTMMRSHYDHVGLVFKDQLDRVFILEAIQSRGVWINQWSELLPALTEAYEEIAYRKLLIPEEKKLNYGQLEKYLNEVLGKKYELSLTKLLIASEEDEDNKENKSTSEKINPEEKKLSISEIQPRLASQRKQIQKKNKKQITYFCSELIADLYIKFGLITGRKKHQFWPLDFEGNLDLGEGFQLGPLMEIQF